MVRAYTRRRIATVDGVEVYQPLDPGTGLEIPLGDWYMTGKQMELLESPVFVARDSQGRIAGTLVGDADPTTRLAEIGVIETYQKGRGYGRQLILAFEAWAREQGADRVILSSATSAQPFWEHMGYVRKYGSVWEKRLS